MMRWILALLCMVMSTTASAQVFQTLGETALKPKTVSLDTLKDVAILDDGRVKPVDTYARHILLQFSGRTHYQDQSAIEWLGTLLFAPHLTRDDQIFLINHPDIPQALGIPAKKRRRYSFNELEAGYPVLREMARSANEMEAKERGIVDQEIVRVYSNIHLYSDLSQVFTFALPHPDFTITDQPLLKELGFPRSQMVYSFLNVASRAAEMDRLAQPLQHKPQETWTATDRALIDMITRMFHWSGTYRELPMTLMPSTQNPEVWLTPWDAITAGFDTNPVRGEILAWGGMVESYWKGDQNAFDASATVYKQSVETRVPPEMHARIQRFPLELIYNTAHLFRWASVLCLFSLIFFGVSILQPWRWLHAGGLACLGAAWIMQVIAIALRILIMDRPPVTNLYETFIFVSALAVGFGLLIEWGHRRWLGIVTGAVSGLLLLMVAGKYSSEGDTMQMLIAVLNSNFWLTTHVLTITAGYSACCVAGVIGHVYLIQLSLKKTDAASLQLTYRYLLGILGLGLTLTFLGTNLGGIWADQSWGRFWGWDPKENGALMIVLWCAILFHAKVGRYIKERGLAVGAVLGLIVVMWAWFGVNLLSVGLHSYGFTSGVANALALYVLLEVVFLIVMGLVTRKNAS